MKNLMSLIAIIITILIAGLAIASTSNGPDLVIEKFYIDSLCRPWATVKNIGNRGLSAQYYNQNASIFSWEECGKRRTLRLHTIDPQKKLMTPGGKTSFMLNSQIRVEGKISLWGYVDWGNRIPETNDRNNAKSDFIRCPNTAEPGKSEIKVVDFQIVNGCNIKVTLRNVGPGPYLSRCAYYNNSFNRMILSIVADGRSYKNISFAELDPNRLLKTRNSQATFTLAKPTNLNIDNKKEVKVKTYNVHRWASIDSSKTKTIQCAPDLVVQNLTYYPKPMYTDIDRKLFSATTKNIGSKPSRDCKMKFKIGGESNAPEYAIPPLNPGQTRTWTRQVNLNRAGNYTIKAEVDSRKQVNEINEVNNIKYSSVRILQASKPDFKVLDITPMGVIRLNQPVTIKARIENTGQAKASYKWSMRVGAEFNPFSGITHNSSPGHIFTISRQVTFTKRINYLIRVKADPNNEVDEINENNNEKVKIVRPNL